MNIALCTHGFHPPLVGGVDVYADRLRRALLRLGHQVSILAFDGNCTDCGKAIAVERTSEAGTPVHRVRFDFNMRPKEAFDQAYDLPLGLVARDELKTIAPDLLVVMNFYTITLAIVEAAKGADLPVAYIATDFLPICRRATLVRGDGRPCTSGEKVRACAACFISQRLLGKVATWSLDRIPERLVLRWAEDYAAGRLAFPLKPLKPYWRQTALMQERLARLSPLKDAIDLVMAPTDYTRERYLESGFRREQVRLAPFGIDVDSHPGHVQRNSAAHTRFLFIGRLQPYKGAHLLVRAFRQLRAPRQSTLTIYGVKDGHDAYYQRLVAEIEGSPGVAYRGKIDPQALGQAFADADYFVLPSTWHENSPLILLDALQSQTPVIASEIGGVTDLVLDGVNGLLFPRGEVGALASLMQRAIDEPGLREQLSQGAPLPMIDAYARTLIDHFQY